jgi:hypothetical protein
MWSAGAMLAIGSLMVPATACHYARPVTIVPVWIADWVYECCGQPRRLGETAQLDLTFEGDTQPASEPDVIEVLSDGQVRVVGTVAGPVADADNHTDGMLVTSGPVQFAVKGKAPTDRVACTGRLWEERHGYPSGRTTGELVGIRWRPAVLRHVGDVLWAVDGYGPGTELDSTDNRPLRDEPDSWAFELTIRTP